MDPNPAPGGRVSTGPRRRGLWRRLPPTVRIIAFFAVLYPVLAAVQVVLDPGWDVADAARSALVLPIAAVVVLTWMRNRVVAALLGCALFSLLGVLLYDLDATGAMVRGIVVGGVGAAALLFLDRAERRGGAGQPG